MKASVKRSLVAAAVAAAIAAPAAHATNGYFKIGYGTKNRGMAGAGIAFAQDSLAPATNPSGIALIGNRLDGGIELFGPLRDGHLDATGLDVDAATGGAVPNMPLSRDTGKVDSGATLFAIPHAGFAFNMGNITAGLSIAANGGMNTRYNSNLYSDAFGPAVGCTSTAAICGGFQSGFAGMLELTGATTAMTDPVLGGLYTNSNLNPALGVNLAQVIISPTVATKLNQDHSIVASLLIGYQRFRSYGLGLFQPLSSSSAHVTNKGDDDSWGAGVRLGWTGDVASNITLGAQASSKIYMQEFERYEGLFAEQGDFDIPANFGVGIAVKMNPQTTVAFDVQRILYGDVAAIANKGPTADQFFAALTEVLQTGAYTGAGRLGDDNGWGFGWEDITIYKLGINHELNSQWTLRGGVNVGGNPIDSDQNLFNILAPGLVEKHLALGFTYAPSQYNEISMTYVHAFYEDQSYTHQGTGGFAPFSYDTKIGMDQNSIEVSYGMKF
ncbi:MAG: outer membrane protein transport protein [Gammaproteobacteria bacterium]|nr:outer membrane protein transport protein [Gammaproteobacteria bacterium]